MSDRTFDANAAFDTYRNAFAPFIRAQQEGLKVFERIAQQQYAVAGDILDFSLAQARSALAARTPAEFAAKQTELGTRFAEKLRGRVQDFVKFTTDTERNFADFVDEAAAKAGSVAKEAAKKAA